MINVVNEFGHSFKGLTAYLLHDIEADSSERVAWTYTHNLATDDPEKASRIMAATGMSQQELKRSAGGDMRGRKSDAHVLHYVLSWTAEERDALTREDMIDAALASMTYYGCHEGEKLGKGKVAKRTQYAIEHQAVIVCHDEGPGSKPHIHIMVNRVHPEHGVMVPDSNDYNKLSAWALDYRTAQGKEDLTPERVKNAAKRAEGLLTSHPRKPRNVYEQEQAIAEADPASRKKSLLEQLERRRKDLAGKDAAKRQKQRDETHALEARHVAAERQERSRSVEVIRQRTAMIRESYAPKIEALMDRQTAEVAAFNEAKGTAAGRVRNAWKAFQTKQWMTDIRSSPLEAMKHSFALAFDSGLQQRDIEKHHAREQSELRGARTREEREARREVRMDEGFRLDGLRQKYHEQRNDLILKHDMEQAKLRAEWKQFDQDLQAVEAEDQRTPKASPGGGGHAPGGGQQERNGPDGAGMQSIKDEHDQQAVPPIGDIPPDRLKRIVEDLKTARELNEQRQQDRDPDQGR